MPIAPLHILIVDDNQEVLNMITMMLQLHGFIVSAQNRVADFVHETKAEQPDLILMDKNLGWANGCDLCALVKKDRSLMHIPVIMLSAYHKVKEDCLFAGADAFLEKPFEMKELLLKIELLTAPMSL